MSIFIRISVLRYVFLQKTPATIAAVYCFVLSGNFVYFIIGLKKRLLFAYIIERGRRRWWYFWAISLNSCCLQKKSTSNIQSMKRKEGCFYQLIKNHLKKDVEKLRKYLKLISSYFDLILNLFLKKTVYTKNSRLTQT